MHLNFVYIISGKSQQGRSKAVHDTSYICWHCGETQANLADYKEHCAKHSAAVRVYTCDICQKKNHNICRLIGHLKGSYLCLMVLILYLATFPEVIIFLKKISCDKRLQGRQERHCIGHNQ